LSKYLGTAKILFFQYPAITQRKILTHWFLKYYSTALLNPFITLLNPLTFLRNVLHNPLFLRNKKTLIMNKYTFILSDESVNSYGQIILTEGINIERFAKNPVMLYMHERNTVIGRWDNIRKEGKQLLADAFFDANIELARTVCLVPKSVDSFSATFKCGAKIKK